MKRFIQQRPIILVAVAAAAIVAAAVLLSGGGDDGGSEPASSQAAAAAEVPEAVKEKAEKAAGPAPEEAAKQVAESAPEAVSEQVADESDDDGKVDREEARAKLKQTIPLAQRQQFVQTAATGVMSAFGYSSADGKINKRDVVTVLTPPGTSCAVALEKIPEVKEQLFGTILFAKKIRLQVYGYGGLNGFVRDNCKPLEPPTAPGQVVWSASGTGVKSSPEFVISATRFTVAYANNGGNLEIYVTRGNALIPPVIKSNVRETGTQTYLGPGTFRVTVAGSGSWAVKVYDGA